MYVVYIILHSLLFSWLCCHGEQLGMLRVRECYQLEWGPIEWDILCVCVYICSCVYV